MSLFRDTGEKERANLKSDIERAKQHPKPLDDSFIGMTVKGVFILKKRTLAMQFLMRVRL